MSISNGGVVADSATTMDYTNWAEMQQNPNPNPNSDPSSHNYPPATYYHNPSYPYQQYTTAIDPNQAFLQSLPQPQPGPPGVDPTPYAPPATYSQPPVTYAQPPATYTQPPVTYAQPQATYAQPPVTYAQPQATYAQPPVSFEPPAAAAAAPYYPVPSVNWQPDPNASWQPDPNVSWQPDPNVSWQPDPNVSWPVAITHFGAPTYAAGVTAPNPAIRPQRSKPHHKKQATIKTTKVVQSAWCEVCKVACNSNEILDQHKSGKKHKKNVEKLKVASTSLPGPAIFATAPANVAIFTAAIVATPPDSVPPTSTTLSTSTAIVATSTPLPVATSAATDGPTIGPENKPVNSNASTLKSKAKSRAKNLRRKAAAALTEDLETKKRKVMEGGTSENNVRACSICNVVCNSAAMFDTHLAGQKHATMARKLMFMPGVAPAM